MVKGSSGCNGETGSDVMVLTVHAGGLVACCSCHFSRQTRALDRLRAFLDAVLVAAPMSCDHLTGPAFCKHTHTLVSADVSHLPDAFSLEQSANSNQCDRLRSVISTWFLSEEE